eukprot:TRINITY_DN111526_c0_g1_i1.p1 TRINITY_DN111526_c0_g1~~TRINITY_DN111526_c0_g1_i1.p1  ORF type:complete len:173 (+),score=56.15 TRINITY_DN111526_c0_g1_i1:93-611(+)
MTRTRKFGGGVKKSKKITSKKASESVSNADVKMGGTSEKKVKKSIKKTRRAAPLKKDVEMGGAAGESKKARRKRIAQAALSKAPAESHEQLKARQAEEWKEMKAKVALLKKERKKLPTKGSKSQKVSAAQEIRTLIEEMEVRHVAERRAAGVDEVESGSKSKSKGADMMSDL